MAFWLERSSSKGWSSMKSGQRTSSRYEDGGETEHTGQPAQSFKLHSPTTAQNFLAHARPQRSGGAAAALAVMLMVAGQRR